MCVARLPGLARPRPLRRLPEQPLNERQLPAVMNFMLSNMEYHLDASLRSGLYRPLSS